MQPDANEWCGIWKCNKHGGKAKSAARGRLKPEVYQSITEQNLLMDNSNFAYLIVLVTTSYYRVLFMMGKSTYVIDFVEKGGNNPKTLNGKI
jgi:hypothetical protein